MRIVATSDCHGRFREAEVPAGDVLVLAGDLLRHPGVEQEDLDDLDEWLASLEHRHKVLIAGNHDWIFEKDKTARPKNAVYLEDSGTTIEGVKFWGSPWQPEFFNWAFNLPRKGPELAAAWDKIPSGTEVLVTHGPPWGILDRPHGIAKKHVGCELLLERVKQLRPKVHIFGHIHGDYGKHFEDGTWFLNASLCDESYDATQPPLVIDL